MQSKHDCRDLGGWPGARTAGAGTMGTVARTLLLSQRMQTDPSAVDKTSNKSAPGTAHHTFHKCHRHGALWANAQLQNYGFI